MPFNQLILPLLGGYFFITYTYFAAPWASRQSKDQILFAYALVGLVLLIFGKVTMLAINSVPLGHDICVYLWKYAKYPGIGSAVMSLVWAVLLTIHVNKIWPEKQANFWVVGKRHCNNLETLFFYSIFRLTPPKASELNSAPIEIIVRTLRKFRIKESWLGFKGESEWTVDCDHLPEGSTDEQRENARLPLPLMIIMQDRKVYVGWLEETSLIAGKFTDFTLWIAWSGYRDVSDLTVKSTTDYSSTFASDDFGQHIKPTKVLKVDHVVSASIFDAKVYSTFLVMKQNSAGAGAV